MGWSSASRPALTTNTTEGEVVVTTKKKIKKMKKMKKPAKGILALNAIKYSVRQRPIQNPLISSPRPFIARNSKQRRRK